jgi:hypothetical protein
MDLALAHHAAKEKGKARGAKLLFDFRRSGNDLFADG